MQFTRTVALAALLCTSTIDAHLSLTFPAPFRSALNPNAVQSQIDYSITAPLAASGANFPCKYNDMGTPGGKSVVTWEAGATANWTVGTGALHGGGSCQVALSYDSGKTFRVIHSYIGSCPAAVGSSADFTVPSDAPAGNAMFTWTWQNQIGNREFYMSCASVNIEAGPSKARAAPAVAFSSRPDLFLVNLGNGCTSVESKAVNYPNPGPDADVTRKASDSGTFTGTCGPVNGVASSGSASGSSSGSSSGSPSESSPAVSASSAPAVSASSAPASVVSSSTTPISIVINPTIPASPTASSATSVATSAPASQTSSTTSPASSGTSSGAVQITTDGLCSGGKTCTGSGFGPCCSKDGFCGIGPAWCGAGCQPGFGTCGTTLNSTATVNPIRKIRGRSWRV
ncbi:carbohydrate-Binding Module family 18 protein [Sclerotinia borealis F-4128]|uniref:Carbohydrate-Binding Module family 18 protein n=1 Tax=Sclerotinia borealis (strain F-4128) TaxID=1432307 RepID=W9CR12_SCLBF|nr:carbohydrate-Binding Module family 18 protein [Sclerotinia borealis F-4128]